MLGEDENSSDPRSFSSKSVRARIEVVIAGVVMNLILGFVIFFIIIGYNGFYTTKVGSVDTDFPAYNAGLRVGDEIEELNGYKISSYNDFSFKMQTVDPSNVTLVVERNNEDITLNMDLKYEQSSGRYLMGFSPQQKIGFLRSDDVLNDAQDFVNDPNKLSPNKAGFFETISQTFLFIWFYFYATVSSLVGLFTGSVGISAMSGPIGIVSVVGDEYSAAAALGFGVVFESMLSMLGIISLALAVFNILPIPALDGGRLVFLIIEAIKGEPINPETEGKIHMIGFMCLMLLALVVTFSDVLKLFK